MSLSDAVRALKLLRDDLSKHKAMLASKDKEIDDLKRVVNGGNSGDNKNGKVGPIPTPNGGGGAAAAAGGLEFEGDGGNGNLRSEINEARESLRASLSSVERLEGEKGRLSVIIEDGEKERDKLTAKIKSLEGERDNLESLLNDALESRDDSGGGAEEVQGLKKTNETLEGVVQAKSIEVGKLESLNSE